jgi:hypothetical protein
METLFVTIYVMVILTISLALSFVYSFRFGWLMSYRGRRPSRRIYERPVQITMETGGKNFPST